MSNRDIDLVWLVPFYLHQYPSQKDSFRRIRIGCYTPNFSLGQHLSARTTPRTRSFVHLHREVGYGCRAAAFFGFTALLKHLLVRWCREEGVPKGGDHSFCSDRLKVSAVHTLATWDGVGQGGGRNVGWMALTSDQTDGRRSLVL